MEGQGAIPQVVYPVRDDEPIGETDQHRDELMDYALSVLQDHFEDQPDVYVSGNNLLYLVEGDPETVVSPDTYVVRGVASHPRDLFKVWEEGGQRPCWVLEITSKTTRSTDLGTKMSNYRDDLSVPECFLFDLRADWIPEQLRAFRLDSAGIYQLIKADSQGRLASQELGLDLGVRDGHVRFFRRGSREPLPTWSEQVREAASAKAEAASAKAEVARLREELDRLRGGS